ncbi:MAG: hypothetical protein J5675_00510 [Bacteroidales bacterium]|nr:hypothetical protein [Bacteroidales bacterium]
MRKRQNMSYKYYLQPTIPKCLQCGDPILPDSGRQDRKFCCQECKNRWHNANRAYVNKRYHTKVSQILENNNRILRHLLTMGVTSIDKRTLRELCFNFEYSTSYYKLGHRQHYACFEIQYDLTPSKIINIESVLPSELDDRTGQV